MSRLSFVLDPRVTGFAVPLLLIVAFAALYAVGVELEVILILTIAAVTGLVLLSRPSFQIVVGAIIIAIIVNMGGYSFLSHTMTGEPVRSASSRIASAAVPIMLLVSSLIVFTRHSAGLWAYLRRNWDVLLFIVVSLFSTAFAFNVSRTLQYVVWFTVSLCSALFFWYFVARRMDLERAGTFLAAVLLVAYAPFLAFALPGVVSYTGQHLRAWFAPGPFYAYAAVGVYASALILMTIDRKSFREKLIRYIPSPVIAAVGLFSVVSVIYSSKRSTIVAVAIVTIVFVVGRMFVNERRRRAASLFRTVALAAALVGVAVWAVPRAERTMMRFGRVVDPTVEDGSLDARRNIYQNSLYVYSKYPVFGVGLANGDNATRELLPNAKKSGSPLHNTFLGILVELGTVGMLLFLLMAVRSAIYFFKLPSKRFKFQILLLGVAPALVSITEYNLTPGQALFWPLWLTVLAPRIMTAFPAPLSSAPPAPPSSALPAPLPSGTDR